MDHVAAQSGRISAAVRAAYYRSRREDPRRHAAIKLRGDQECILQAVAQAFGVNNVLLSLRQMQELVGRKWGVKVSRMWVPRFVKQHKRELRKRACKALSDKGTRSEVYGGVVQVCEELKTFLSHHHLASHAVLKYDETRVVLRGNSMSLLRVEAAGKEQANVRSTRHA